MGVEDHFDGGAIQYVMLANKTSPYPFDAGAVRSLGTLYNKSFLPKAVTLTAPIPANSVVYDVFEHAIVKPQDAKIKVDLTTFPGRLYAIARRRRSAADLARREKRNVFVSGSGGRSIRQADRGAACRWPSR